MINIGERDIA